MNIYLRRNDFYRKRDTHTHTLFASSTHTIVLNTHAHVLFHVFHVHTWYAFSRNRTATKVVASRSPDL